MKICKKTYAFIVLISVFSSCNSFESDFYNIIDDAQKQAIKNQKTITFDLNSITSFEWTSVLLVRGNESVRILGQEIEVDLMRKAEDLGTFRDRFYFLTPEGELIIREIKSGIYSHRPAFELELCKTDSLNYRTWLTKKECVFTLIPNSKVIGSGTVFLFPKCETKFDRNNFGIFYKE